MKLSCLQENLSKGLSTVCRVVPAAGSLPVLSNVLLQTDEGRLKLQATDLETGVTTWVGAKISEEGSITVPAKVFSRLVANLSPGEITLEVKRQTLFLKSSSVESEFNGLSAKEFPELSVLPVSGGFALQSRDLKEGIEGVVFAAAQDEGRPILTGVLFRGQEKELTLVGVDGFRLAEKKLRFDKNIPPVDLVVPARTLRELALILGKEGKDVRIFQVGDENQILFGVGDVCFSSRILEGEFPNYQEIVPAEFSTQFKLPREGFLKAVQLASLFAEGGANVVRIALSPSEGLISVSANAPEIGNNKVEVRGDGEGEEAKIAFNAHYLIDCLSALSSEQVVFEMTESLKPAAVYPVLDSKDSKDCFHVVMPVRVQE